MLAPATGAEVGDLLTEPRIEVLYEDGSPSPPDAYPLAAAVRTGEPQTAVRGHRGPDGAMAWIEVAAHPLRLPADESVYGILGVLTDLTAERDWEHRQLRAPGQLGRTPAGAARHRPHPRRDPSAPVPGAVRLRGATAQRRPGGAVRARHRRDAPAAPGRARTTSRSGSRLRWRSGPELAEDGIPELAAHVARRAARGRPWPHVAARPGDRAAARAGARPTEALAELARHGAAAMELAGGYTDVFDAARRRKETQPAAELQQSLLPPRIARIGGGEIAGSVLPAYEVGGDWFDYVENRDGAWIAVADAVGKGSTAGALGGIALAALRAARRSDATLEEAAKTMHEAIFDVSRPEFFVTAVVARWNAVYSSFSWINCGHPPPLRGARRRHDRAAHDRGRTCRSASGTASAGSSATSAASSRRRAPDPPLRRHHRAAHRRRAVRPRRDRAGGARRAQPLGGGHGEGDSGSGDERGGGPAPGRRRGRGAGPGAAAERPWRRPNRGLVLRAC